MTSHVAEVKAIYSAFVEDLENTVYFFCFSGDKGIAHKDGKS